MFFDFIFDIRWKLQEWKKERRKEKVRKWGKKKEGDKLLQALSNNYCDDISIAVEIIALNQIKYLMPLLSYDNKYIKIMTASKLIEKEAYVDKNIENLIVNCLVKMLERKATKQKLDFGEVKWVLKSINKMKSVDGMIKILTFGLGVFRDEAIDFLGEFGDEKALEYLFSHEQDWRSLEAVYKIGIRSKEKGLTEVEDKVVNFFINQLSAKDHTDKYAASYLGDIGSHRAIGPLVNFFKTNRSDVSHYAALALKKLGWKPDNKIDEAYFYLAMKQEADLISMGAIGLKVLLDDFLFEYDYHRVDERNDCYILKFLEKMGEGALDGVINCISKIDRKVISDNNSSIKMEYFEKQAVLIVFLGLLGNKRTCEYVIDWLFKYPGLFMGWELSNKRDLSYYGITVYFRELSSLQHLFESYTQIILDCSGYNLYRDEDDSTGHAINLRFNHKNSDASINELINLQTDISNNILHKIAQKKQIYSYWSISGIRLGDRRQLAKEDLNNHFEKQRITAEKELRKRGNPAYDPNLYLDEMAWKIQK